MIGKGWRQDETRTETLKSIHLFIHTSLYPFYVFHYNNEVVLDLVLSDFSCLLIA